MTSRWPARIGCASSSRIRCAASAASWLSVDVLEQDGELVAAEAGRGVRAADARVEAAGDLDEHLVAGGVPERVVDRLEVVEVEEDDRQAAALAAAAGDRLAHLLGEHRAVGEAR